MIEDNKQIGTMLAMAGTHIHKRTEGPCHSWLWREQPNATANTNCPPPITCHVSHLLYSSSQNMALIVLHPGSKIFHGSPLSAEHRQTATLSKHRPRGLNNRALLSLLPTPVVKAGSLRSRCQCGQLLWEPSPGASLNCVLLGRRGELFLWGLFSVGTNILHGYQGDWISQS